MAYTSGMHFRRYHQSTWPAWKGLNAHVKHISLIFLVYVIGWGIVTPYLPLYLRQVLGDYTSVGLVLSLVEFFTLVWGLLLGPALDRINKKTLISIVLIFYTPLSFILVSLTSLTQFILFRVYHSAIATSLWLPSEAYLRGHTPQGKEAQAIGLFDFCQGMAVVAGGLLGATFVTLLGFNILYAVSLFSFLAFFLSLSLPDHTKSHLLTSFDSWSPGKIKEEIREYMGDKRLRVLTMYAFPFYFTVAFLGMAVPLFSQSLGAALPMIGVTAALLHLPTLFESYFSTNEDQGKTVRLGLVFGAILFLALATVKNPVTVLFLAMLLGISLAAVHPILSGRFTLLMPKKKIGQYSAVLFATKGIAAGASPLLAGVVADAFGLRYVFIIGFTIFAMLLLFRRRCMEFAGKT